MWFLDLAYSPSDSGRHCLCGVYWVCQEPSSRVSGASHRLAMGTARRRVPPNLSVVQPSGAAPAHARDGRATPALALAAVDSASGGYQTGGRGFAWNPRLWGTSGTSLSPASPKGPRKGGTPAFPRGPRASRQLERPEGAEQGAGAGFSAGRALHLS